MGYNINPPSMQIPGIVSQTRMVEVQQGEIQNYGVRDANIKMSEDMLLSMCRYIIDREMDQLKKDNPGVDTTKIQQMWESGDQEMKNLASQTMEVYTRYTWRIMQSITSSYVYREELENIIVEYTKKNRFNLGGRII